MNGNLKHHHNLKVAVKKENGNKPMSKKRRQPNSEQTSSHLRPKKINPLTDAQKDMFDAYREGYNLFLTGCAGTGKTFCALYLGLKDVMSGSVSQPAQYRKVYIVRSAVPSRDVGFLPGTLKEKLKAFEDPYKPMFSKLFGRDDAWEIALHKGLIDVISTSYMRGITLDNCVVIVDESQNMNYQELATIATRPGDNCRIIFCGDMVQNDLYRNRYDVSGFAEFQSVVKKMPSMEIVEFFPEDIVRGGFCKEFILAELGLIGDEDDSEVVQESAA